MQKRLILFGVAIVAVSLLSCKKNEGEGGTASIKGKLIKHDFNVLWNSEPVVLPVADERVFIIYGPDRSTYDDDFRTSFDGSYEFKYLQKGKYRLFSYSKDSTGAYIGNYNPNSPHIPIFVDVEITSNGQAVTAPDIIIVDNKQ